MDNYLQPHEIINLVRKFHKSPRKEDYDTIDQWYEENVHSPDQEFITCLYIFLLGANIKNQYYPISKQDHYSQIKTIRDLIELADPLAKAQRKVYLDYGTKSGQI